MKRSKPTVVVPGDRPEVRDELATELQGEPVRVVADRRRAPRRARVSSTQAITDPQSAGNPGQAGASKTMIIVSSGQSEHYDFATQHLADDPNVEVLYDRRQAGRRVVNRPVSHEQRQSDRRRRDLGPDLRAVGWAVARVGLS